MAARSIYQRQASLAHPTYTRRVLGNTMACKDLDSDANFSRPRIMLLPCHRLCLIRLFPVMLVCVVGINGCSTGQRFLSQPPEPARASEPARVQAPASAELPYYASRPGMKVYSVPRRGSRVLATLTRHQKVLRSDVQRGYARIRTPDGRIQGWVDNGLLIWRLPASKPSGTRTAAVKCPPQSAPAASPAEQAASAEPAAPAVQAAPVETPAPTEPAALAEQVAPAEPAAPAVQAAPVETPAPTEPVALAEQAAPAEPVALAEPAVPAEQAAPAETSPPAENTDGLQVRPGAEVFDRF